MTYAKSGLFWSQCFLPSLVIRKSQAGGGKSSLGLLWYRVVVCDLLICSVRPSYMCDLLYNINILSHAKGFLSIAAYKIFRVRKDQY